jgi:hypothetical protein
MWSNEEQKEVQDTLVNIVKHSMEDFVDKTVGEKGRVHISRIDNEELNAHMEKIISGKTITSLGIHSVYVLDYHATADRLRIEYTALCWLSEHSRKYEKLVPGLLDHEDKLNTSESLIVMVSYRAYQMFQCLRMGISQLMDNDSYQEAKQQGKMIMVMVINSSIGQLMWPSEEDREYLFTKSKWTTDLLKTYNIMSEIHYDKKKLMISIRNLRLGNYFYVQSSGDWC